MQAFLFLNGTSKIMKTYMILEPGMKRRLIKLCLKTNFLRNFPRKVHILTAKGPPPTINPKAGWGQPPPHFLRPWNKHQSVLFLWTMASATAHLSSTTPSKSEAFLLCGSGIQLSIYSPNHWLSFHLSLLIISDLYFQRTFIRARARSISCEYNDKITFSIFSCFRTQSQWKRVWDGF